MTPAFNRWFVNFGFRFGLGILILVAFLYYSQRQSFHDSFSWVMHTSQVRNALSDLSQALDLSERPEVIQEQLNKIQSLRNDNPRQIARLKVIRGLIKKIEESDLTESRSQDLKLYQEGLKEQILVTIKEMHAEESQLLEEGEAASRESILLIDLPIAIGGIFACFLIYMANRITKQDLYQLVRKDQELQKQAQSLRQSRDNLAMQTKILNLTMESMAEGLIVLNNKKEFLQFNSAARKLLGVTGDNALSETVEVKRKDPKTLREIPDEETPSILALEGKEISNFEILVEPPNAESKVLSFNSRPLIDENGNSLGAITVFRDITQSKAMEEAMRKAQQEALETAEMKSMFLANMSHEIRTPMNGIVGMTELLAQTNLNEKQKSYVNFINDSCQNLLTIINDILDFSKIEAGKLEIEKTDFSLPFAVDHTVRLLSPKAREKSLTLLTYINPKIPIFLRGDPGRIGQVLVNLIGNAVKFTNKGKVIVWVDIQKDTNNLPKLQFKVQDTGIGIPQEKVSSLFNPFSQIDASTSRKYGGTGLGLSICKQLVELMGGDIGVESQVGIGSTFWFTVPLEKPSLQQPDPPDLTLLPKEKILLFDPDPISSKILNSYLMTWHLESKTIQNLSDLEMMLTKNNDLSGYGLAIVSDYPVQSQTKSVLSLLNQAKNKPKISVIVDTEDSVLEATYRSFGVWDYLSRPVTQSDLYAHLITMMTDSSSQVPQGEMSLTPSEQNPPSRPQRILLAEDNTVNQLIAQTFLKELGHSVHTVANGKEALNALKQSNYDLILMDCQMPELDGFEATREIRKNISNQIPIVALTANAMKGDEEKCKSAGMNGYLAKPFRKDQLQTALQEHMTKPPAGFDPARLDLFKDYKDENGADLRISMVQLYLRTAPEGLHELQRCLVSDPKNFSKTAHTLKSSTASVGGVILARMFEDLEHFDGPDNKRQEKLQAAQEEFHNLKSLLTDYIGKIS